MEDPLLWAVICIGLALLLFVLEVFVPSGGVLGFLSGVALVVAIFLLFRVDQTLGLIGAIVSLIAIPFFTPIGRMLTLSGGHGVAVTGRQPVADKPVVGAVGRTVTDLHPVGTCLFEGKRIECLADRHYIDREKPVRVVAVDGMQVRVREAES